MDYVTEPSVQEMFFYLVIVVGEIALLALAILSPLIVIEVLRAFRK